MDSCVILDPSVFPYQDVRYTGKGTGAKPKIKKDAKLSPIVPKPKVSVRGDVVIPQPSSGSGVTEGGSMGGDGSCNTGNGSCNTERSVVKYIPSVNNKGMCVSLLVV